MLNANFRKLAPLAAAIALTVSVSACSAQSPSADASGSATSTASAPAADSPSASAVERSPSPAAESASPKPEKTDCKKDKCIALTYDDGPSTYTPKLLKTMAKYDAHATFFLIGPSATEYPDTVRDMVDQGMEIGNHTRRHKALTQISSAQVKTELSDTQKRIHKITGEYPTVMRPPYGSRSNSVDKIAGKQGLAVINWDTSPVDWEKKPAKKVADIVIREASRNQIVLMHDTHPWTVAAAPRIYKELSKKGYKFVTVSELLSKPKPGKLYPTN